MTEDTPRAALFAGVALTATLVAVGAWLGLARLAEPADFTRRHADLQGRIVRAEQLARVSQTASSYGPRAVCPSVGLSDVESVQQRLVGAAAQTGVVLTDFSTALPEDPGARGRIAPVGFRLQAEGGYEAILNLLEMLAQTEPQLFIDGLDLVSASPNVRLKLTGKVYCWTSARH